MSFTELPANLTNPTERITAVSNWDSSLAPVDSARKHQLMSNSPHTFFRGTNYLFWADVTKHREFDWLNDESTKTVITGDMHAFQVGATGRVPQISFGINDVDEAIVSGFHYDLLRMAVSSQLIAQKQVKPQNIDAVTESLVWGYINHIRELGENNVETAGELNAQTASGKLGVFLEKLGDKPTDKWLEKMIKIHNGRLVLDTSLPENRLILTTESDLNEITTSLPEYLQGLGSEFEDIQILDIANRVQSGNSSYGLRRHYILAQNQKNLFILDVKLEKKPTAYFFLPDSERDSYTRMGISSPAEDAKRCEFARKALTSPRDPFSGVIQTPSGDFLIGERTPIKEPFPFQEVTKHHELQELMEQIGRIIAASHNRAYKVLNGNNQFAGNVLALIGKNPVDFTKQTLDFAKSEAKIVHRDFAYFTD